MSNGNNLILINTVDVCSILKEEHIIEMKTAIIKVHSERLTDK